MDKIKENFTHLLLRIKNTKLIESKKYKGKIFRANTRGMYIIPRVKLRLDEFKQFIQRGRCGYSYVDCYSIKCWFLENIVNLLGDMILDLHGYPIYFKSFEEWKKALEEMRECFRQSNEETCDKEYEDNFEYRNEQLKKGLELFVKYFDDLWD